jgi:hypothetical protein
MWSALAVAVLGYDVAVSPSGDDAHGDGTAARPFASISRAQQAVRQFLAVQTPLTSDVTVTVAAGQYFVPAGLHFGSKDSGRDGFKVVYRGTAATTELFGGVKLSQWEPDPTENMAGVWRTNVSAVPELQGKRFFNLLCQGEAAVLARAPDAGSGYMKELGCSNSDVQITCPQEVLPAELVNQAGDMSVFANLGADWFTDTRKVQSVAQDKGAKTVTIHFEGGKHPHGIIGNKQGRALGDGLTMSANDKVYLQGGTALISEPGEWALDSTTKFVHYWPHDEEVAMMKAGELSVVAVTTKVVLDIAGESFSDLAQGLVFENFQIKGSDFDADYFYAGLI